MLGRPPPLQHYYNQLHMIMLSLWMQWPVRGVQMSHRWTVEFRGSARADWILTREFSHHKQQSADVCTM